MTQKLTTRIIIIIIIIVYTKSYNFKIPFPLLGNGIIIRKTKSNYFKIPFPFRENGIIIIITSCKVPWAQVSHSPIRSRDLKTNYGILKPIHDFLFNFNGN